MQKNDKKRGKYPIDISSIPVDSTPETAFEMVNAYGTYNIQATATSDDTYPAIAQGIAKKDCPDEKFYRD